MPLSPAQKNQHLLWRAGFGPAVEQFNDLSQYTPSQMFRALVKASSKKPDYINVADDYLQGLYMGLEEAGRQQRKEMSAEERKKVQQKNREGIRNLNLYWLSEMVNSSAQLREKIALFWHGHFACRNLNIFFQQGLLDVIRRNALGNFGTMLKEVSRTAAMLNFLNNQQNRKDHPNENFAREVMELFTLGRGHYTETDVKEAARAFTGWSANLRGDFVFRRFQHDFGTKTVLGQTGNFDGDEVLDILLAQPQTARFITAKLWRFLVSDTPDEQRINALADRFFQSGYDISKLLEDIFTSDWFYESRYVGVRIKSPVELLAGIQRMLPMKLEDEESLLLLQRALGQLLFYPPNVAGWPGGRNWIDSSTLMLRMRIPQLLNETDEFNIRPKDDDDQMMGRRDGNAKPAPPMAGAGRMGRAIRVEIDWKPLLKGVESVPREKLLSTLSDTLLQTRPQWPADMIRGFSDESGRENFVKTATLQLMSTPEYQLC